MEILNTLKLEPFESELGMEFRKYVKGKNFLTDTILGYIDINCGVAEITQGPKFLDLEMYGVTVVKHNIKNDELSKCLHSKEDVVNYIKELKKDEGLNVILKQLNLI